MRLTSKGLVFIAILFQACATKPPEKVLTFSEQIEVDTERAQSLFVEFQKQVTFVSMPKSEKYLVALTKKLALADPSYKIESVRVKVHQDVNPKLSRFFSFPGTTLSIPESFLKQVQFENELAAAIAYELSNVMKRTLANRVEKHPDDPHELFGPSSVFNLAKEEKVPSIQEGVKLLYYAGFDTRGMPSIFQRYSQYYVTRDASDLYKKEVSFNVREAQKAKSEFLPTLKPVVRSDEFIQFKKDLN